MELLCKSLFVVDIYFAHVNHRLNGSLSPVLTATSHFYGIAKNSTPTESKPLIRFR